MLQRSVVKKPSEPHGPATIQSMSKNEEERAEVPEAVVEERGGFLLRRCIWSRTTKCSAQRTKQ